MKICRVVNKFTYIDNTMGDIVPLFYNQCKLLVDKGHEVHVVCGISEQQNDYEIIEGIHVHRVSPITNRRSYLFGDFAKKSFAKIKELSPDIIHGDTSIHFGCITNKKKLNIPILTHFHTILDSYKYMDYLPISYNPIEALNYRFMIWTYFYENMYILKKSDGIIAVSEASKKAITKYIPQKNIYVVYNGFDKHFKKVDTNIKSEIDTDYLIMYAGRPIPWKGVQYLIRAMPELNKEFGNIKLLLLGVVRSDMKIYYQWLMDMTNKLGVKNIIFSESVHYVNLPKYYSSADCFVLPSYPEGFGLVNIEAQACSCPVVATDGGGTPEIMDTSAGLLCKPKNVNDLKEKIRMVLLNPSKFNGRKNAEKFTWERSVESLCKYYESMMETR